MFTVSDLDFEMVRLGWNFWTGVFQPGCFSKTVKQPLNFLSLDYFFVIHEICQNVYEHISINAM